MNEPLFFKAFDTLMKHDLESTKNSPTRERCVEKAFLEYMMKEHDTISVSEKEALLENHGIIILQRQGRFE